MTSHRGAWVLRIGVVAAMVAGTLTGLAAPAQADHDVRLGSIGNVSLRVGGGAQTVTVRVENRGQDGHTNDTVNASFTLTVPGGLGVYISTAPNGCSKSGDETRMDCTAELGPNQTYSGVVQIAVHGNAPVQAGENRSGEAELRLTSPSDRSQRFNVQVQGPERAPTTGDISGVVTDQDTGQPVEGAKVLLVDSQQQDFETFTNAQGQFRFSGQDIAAGNIALRASKDGFESGGESTHNVGENQNLDSVRLALINTATPSPSASPSATPSADPTATATASVAPATEPASSGRSFFTTLMIILGVLFVALGVGAIVLLIIRNRRRAREEGDEGFDGFDDSDDPTSGPQGPGPTPGSHGVYRPTPTQVAGAGGQTQVMGPDGAPVPGVGPRPALAESQTMLQRGATGSADETAMFQRTGGADETAMIPRADANPASASPAETAMIPRAAEPPGPRPPAPGSPSVRPASPQATTYGAAGAASGGPAGIAAGQAASPVGYGSPVDPASGSGFADTRGYADERTYGGTRAYGADRGYGNEPGHGAERGFGDARGYGDERGYADRGYGNRGYGERGPSDDRGFAGYDQPTGRHDRPALEAGPSAGYPSDSYGPDPYTQPSAGGHAGNGARPDYSGGGGQDYPTEYGRRDGGQGRSGYGAPGYGEAGYGEAGPAYGDTRYGGSGYESGYPDAAGRDAGYHPPGPDPRGQVGQGYPGPDTASYGSSSYGTPGGYDAGPGYDDRAGYSPDPGYGGPGHSADPYDGGRHGAPGQAYGGPAEGGGYGAAGGYGNQGDYGNQGGYANQGGYGGPGAGYGAQDGYGAHPGYGAQDGYRGREQSYDAHAYPETLAQDGYPSAGTGYGYDQSGQPGYPAPEYGRAGSPPADRRRLDWLDD